jgi:hypothetical protein
MYGKRWGLRPNMVHWLCTRVKDLPYCMLPGFSGPQPSKQASKQASGWGGGGGGGVCDRKEIQLCRIHKMACLAIMGAMKSIPIAAMDMFLNLTPLDLLSWQR